MSTGLNANQYVHFAINTELDWKGFIRPVRICRAFQLVENSQKYLPEL